jgi:hypothetical protein
MIDFLLDPVTNDIYILNGKTKWANRVEVVTRQRVYITMNTNRGEWVFNIDFGIPWMKNPNNPIQLLGKTPKAIIDAYIKEAILSKETVISLDTYVSVLDKETRIMNIEFEAESQAGEIITGRTQLQI